MLEVFISLYENQKSESLAHGPDATPVDEDEGSLPQGRVNR